MGSTTPGDFTSLCVSNVQIALYMLLTEFSQTGYRYYCHCHFADEKMRHREIKDKKVIDTACPKNINTKACCLRHTGQTEQISFKLKKKMKGSVIMKTVDHSIPISVLFLLHGKLSLTM